MSRLNLSQTQIAMTEQAFPGSARNTISLKLHLPEHTPQQVKKAADAVLDSADIFAASLRCREGEWIFSRDGGKISECGIGKERAADLAEEDMSVMDRRPFSVEQCLYQAEVIPLSGGGVFLYVRFHHVIIDGYGMSLFVQKVLDVLAGKKIVRSVFFPEEMPVSGEMSVSEEMPVSEELSFPEAAHGSGAAGADISGRDGQEDGFWQSYFAGAEYESAVFPQREEENRPGRDRDRDRAAGNSFGSCRASVPEKLLKEAEAFGEREDISIPYIFAAAYALYLAKATNKKDAVFLMPRLNRTFEQMDTLGCYTLLVPVRVRVEGTDTFAELCRKVKRASGEASAHKGCGFDRILSALRAENMTGESLSEYVFNFYRFSFHADFRYSVRFSVAGEMSNHLTFNLFRLEKDGLELQADYREGVYTAEKAGYFCDAMLAVLAQTAKKLSDIRTVGEAEYNKITSVRGKSFPIEANLTIPSLFRNAVLKDQDAPALYAGEYAFTFGELDEISARIACGLRRLGVKGGDSIAFLLKRDYRLIPTILGISKAGAAFIPVDPAYPADRISYIMENSGAACLISSEEV
ncbi:MAG: non-ribosomal peptide synthetase, partial [Lachnospiraceae bacterium]|nr:non-ribosomal peptide synthetase [Lachnospiraceae bacterium]